MSSKAFVLLGLLFAAILLVSSTVVAETSKDEKKQGEAEETKQVADSKKRCHCCGGYWRGICNKYCCTSPLTKTETMPENLDMADQGSNQLDDAKNGGHGGHGGGGHGGGYGGGGHGGHGGGGHGYGGGVAKP